MLTPQQETAYSALIGDLAGVSIAREAKRGGLIAPDKTAEAGDNGKTQFLEAKAEGLKEQRSRVGERGKNWK